MKFVWKVSLIAIALGLLISPLGPVAVLMADDNQGQETACARLLVQFIPGTTANDMQRVHRQAGGEFDNIIPGIGVQVVSIPSGQLSVGTNAYGLLKEVRSVDVDAVAGVVDIPNDSYFDYQWGLTRVEAPQAWDITQGSPSVCIAILDTGIETNHPGLASKIVSSINFTDSPTPDENGHSHGTHVAGIAAAATNNGAGVAGLGYQSTLMNVKVLGDDGFGYHSWIANGIIWAADNGADVINLSLGGGITTSTLENAVNYAWSQGVVVVAAAGDDGDATPFYPAYYINCLAAAGTDASDNLASWSNRGSWVDVAAPGSSIYSTMPDGKYGYKSGTSMASPFVAGLSALVLSVITDTNGNGRLNDDVRSTIETTCDDVGINVAHGRINAYSAVQGSSIPSTGQISGTVTDAGAEEPIAGAMVSDGTRSDISGATGYYEIEDVTEGTYTITASATGYIMSTQDDVSVTSGNTTVVDFVLNQEPEPTPLPTESESPSAENNQEQGTFDIRDRINDSGSVLDTLDLGSPDGAVKIKVSSGTSAFCVDGKPLESIDLHTVAEPPVAPAEYRVIGNAADLGPDGSTFYPPLCISLQYDPSLLPVGIGEEDLVIAYFDEENEKWIELQCTVDPATNTVTADVNHFTLFAVMGKAASPSISIQDVTVSPDEVVVGEFLTITAEVSNSGEIEVSCELMLRINGEPEATEVVTIASGVSEVASFTVSRDVPGIYDVEIEGYMSQFTVVASTTPAVTIWPMVVGIIAFALGLGLALVLIVIRRKHEAKPHK